MAESGYFGYFSFILAVLKSTNCMKQLLLLCSQDPGAGVCCERGWDESISRLRAGGHFKNSFSTKKHFLLFNLSVSAATISLESWHPNKTAVIGPLLGRKLTCIFSLKASNHKHFVALFHNHFLKIFLLAQLILSYEFAWQIQTMDDDLVLYYGDVFIDFSSYTS